MQTVWQLSRRKGLQQQEKEASVKLDGRGPLFGEFGPLRRRKGAQQQAKEASVKVGGRGPLFEGFGPLRRQKGVQQQEKEAHRAMFQKQRQGINTATARLRTTQKVKPQAAERKLQEAFLTSDLARIQPPSFELRALRSTD